MGEVDENVCPECHAIQSSDGPFCDDCGYRLGRPETELEARAIARVPFTRGAAPKSDRDTDLENKAVSAADLSNDRATAVEGVRAITREEALTAAAPTERNPAVPAPKKAPGTGPVDLVAPRLPTADPDIVSPSSVATSTELRAVVPEDLQEPDQFEELDETPSRVLLIGVWLASLIAVAMVTEYAVRDTTPVDLGLPTTRDIAPSRIAVKAGEFRRGLNEQVRANILTTCLRMSDDKSTCKQEELLAGEYPEENVSFNAFAIDSLEVTVGEYSACVTAGACAPINWKDCKVYTLAGFQSALRAPKSLQQRDMALTCVSRPQAQAFCGWRTGRLPTHDEWERAARGTDGRVYPWGSFWKPTAANWGELDVVRMPVPGKIDGAEWVAPPGQYEEGASPINAWDMAGNVSEWVSGELVAARGGSWTSNPFDLRVTGRLELDPSAVRTDVGFRCAY